MESLDTESITGNGRVYGGGLYKMEPKELANIPAGFFLERLNLHQQANVARQRDLFDALEEGDHLPA